MGKRLDDQQRGFHESESPMTNILQIIEAGCIIGLLVACVAAGYLWLVN